MRQGQASGKTGPWARRGSPSEDRWSHGIQAQGISQCVGTAFGFEGNRDLPEKKAERAPRCLEEESRLNAF